MDVRNLFKENVIAKDNFIVRANFSSFDNQQHTNEAFSEKWTAFDKQEDKSLTDFYNLQYKWYLELYGFKSEADLGNFLKGKVILDAGCGLGYKAAWFAQLAPDAIVIGMDFSEAANIAAKNYKHIKNLYFVRGDIADTGIKENCVDYVSCDQVIHHTEFPEKTFAHLTSITKIGGEFACYVYAKKALPRELLDEHFREFSKTLSKEQIWELSEALTVLGKNLSALNVKIQCPDIPLLDIKGGEYDLQRFIYWNFLKCFWNSELGFETSKSVNFDWYSPSNASRYSETEYKKIVSDNHLSITYFHQEEACFSGRFKK